MSFHETLLLVSTLPDDSPYFAHALGTGIGGAPLPFEDRLAIGCFDPAFFWNVAKAYASAGLALPEIAWPCSIHRAYRYLLDPTCSDQNLTAAHQLQLPESQVERDLVHALLLCHDISHESIGCLLEVESEAIGLFQTLFWNIPCNPLHLTALLNSRNLAKKAALGQGLSNQGIELVRLAAAGRGAKAVLAAVGWTDPSQEGAEAEDPIDALVAELAANALAGLQGGFVEKDQNPCLDWVVNDSLRPTLARSAEEDPLSLLSQDPKFAREFRINQAERATEFLAAQKKFQEQEQTHRSGDGAAQVSPSSVASNWVEPEPS